MLLIAGKRVTRYHDVVHPIGEEENRLSIEAWRAKVQR
jgi:hypothetical protein